MPGPVQPNRPAPKPAPAPPKPPPAQPKPAPTPPKPTPPAPTTPKPTTPAPTTPKPTTPAPTTPAPTTPKPTDPKKPDLTSPPQKDPAHPNDDAIATERSKARLGQIKNPSAPTTDKAELDKRIDAAKQLQKDANYKPDDYTIHHIKKGDRFYGGFPSEGNPKNGPYAFYTDEKTLKDNNWDQRKLFDALQVNPHDKFGGRKQIQVYEAIADMDVPAGKATNNPGTADRPMKGGGQQYVIPYAFLKPVGTKDLDVSYGWTPDGKPLDGAGKPRGK